MNRREFLYCLSIFIASKSINRNLFESVHSIIQTLDELPVDIRGNESEISKTVNFSIDDCNNVEVLRGYHEFFQQEGIPYLLFPNSDNIDLDDPDQISLWREIYTSGLVEIGYHTTNHQQEWTTTELNSDLEKFTQKMRQVLNDDTYQAHLARPPYGNWNRSWMNFIRDNQLSNLRWNIVAPNANLTEKYMAAVFDHPEGGHIFLLHTRQSDLDWLKNNFEVISRLAQARDLTISNLSEFITPSTTE